jgi:hypothetical protein
MFTDVGSAASLVGVIVSLLGLGFAILQLAKLRGETRAARDAAESARAAIRRELTNTELVRLDGTIQNLKEVHRTRNRDRALYEYATVLRALREIRLSHPTLSPDQQTEISRSISAVSNMEQAVEALPGEILQDASVELNRTLNEIQSGLLLELENQLARENS